MATTRRMTSRGRGRSQAPGTWARFVDDAPVTVAAGTKVLFASFILSNIGINETVRRTRGIIHMRSDQAAGNEDQAGAFGMIVVTDLAVAAGAASIPGPVTDASDDGWFVWVPMIGAGATVTEGRVGFSFEFDSRAMRRVQEGFTIALMYENASATLGLVADIGVSLYTTRSR